MNKELLILGNGMSRLNYSEFIDDYKEDIWCCNFAFKENIKYNLVGSVHDFCIKDAVKFKEENNLNFEILYHSKMINYENKYNIFKKYQGYSTGSELIVEAILRGYSHILLLGFDSLSNNNSDIYTKNLVIKNFIAQVEIITKKYLYTKQKLKDNMFLLWKK
jgi:hypothetical protein